MPVWQSRRSTNSSPSPAAVAQVVSPAAGSAAPLEALLAASAILSNSWAVAAAAGGVQLHIRLHPLPSRLLHLRPLVERPRAGGLCLPPTPPHPQYGATLGLVWPALVARPLHPRWRNGRPGLLRLLYQLRSFLSLKYVLR